MKLVKFTIIFLSLFLCSLLSAQEAQKSFSITPNKIEQNEKSDISMNKANIFAEEFIMPILSGEVYNLEIENIQLLSDYQEENPLKCHFDDKDTYTSNGCHDANSYRLWFDTEYFDEEPFNDAHPPFQTLTKKYNIDPSKSIIVSFKIKLDKSFKDKLLSFLNNETSGKASLSFDNVPKWNSGEASQNEYFKCRWYGQGCTNELGIQGGKINPDPRRSKENGNFVIDFIDREQKTVTFYNLHNFGKNFEKGRKHRFLNNVCGIVNRYDTQFERAYINQKEDQFYDIAITFYDQNNDVIHRDVINTSQPADRLYPQGRKEIKTYGLALKNRYIFAYDYGSNSYNAEYADHLNYRAMIGHLINRSKGDGDFEVECNTYDIGAYADVPAFDLVSNYEYNLIVELNNEKIQKISSLKINYVPGNTNEDRMLIFR